MAIFTIIRSAINLGTAFLFGCTGETITEKSGHLNLGIPGIMCMGALGGCRGVAMYMKGTDPANINGLLLLLSAMLLCVIYAGITGAIYAFLTVGLRCNQNVTGLTVTTFGIGCSKYFIKGVNTQNFNYASESFSTLFPFSSKMNEFWQIFFGHGSLVYIAILVALITAYVFKKTRVGLKLRAIGENPAAADAAGVNVTKYKYCAILIGSAVAGLGGLFYIMDFLHGSWEYDVDAIGWLSVALVIFTLWKPDLGILGSFLFGALRILPTYISFLPRDIAGLLPYVVTVVVLIVTSVLDSKENQPPAALGLAYFREDR